MIKNITDTYKDRLLKANNAAQPHWERAIENYKHYLSRLDVGGVSEDDYPFQSRMTIPISYEIVETVIPRMIGKDPEWTATAKEPGDVPFEPSSKIALETQYDNPKYQMMGEPIYLKLYKGVKECLITGNAVWKNSWRRETKKAVKYLANLDRAGIKDSDDIQKVMKMAEEMGIYEEVKYTKKLVEQPFLDDYDLSPVPFFLFLPDPAFDLPGKWRYEISREFMSFEELAEEANMFKYDNVKMEEVMSMVLRGSHGSSYTVTKDFMSEYNDLFNNVSKETFYTDDDKVPLLLVDKMWEPSTGQVHVFINENFCMTGETGMSNPYDVQMPPFTFAQDVPIPHSYYCRGEIDSIRKLEDGMTDIYNMRFDNLIQSMVQMYLVNPNYINEGDSFLPIPGSVTEVKDIDKAIKGFRADDVTASAYKEADDLYSLIGRTTGVNDYVKGMEGDTIAGRTYGGLRLVQEMANARFIVKSRLFENLTLKSIGYFILEMSRQFMNKDRIARTVGEFGNIDEKKIKASDLKSIKGFMDIKVVPNSAMVVDQQVEAIRLNGVADRFVSEKGPFAGIPSEVYDKFLTRFLSAYGISDAIHWVRLIKENREKLAKEEKKAAKETPANPAPTMPQMPAIPMPGMPGAIPAAPNQEMFQSDQISSQPSPLASILNAGNLPMELPGQNPLIQ